MRTQSLSRRILLQGIVAGAVLQPRSLFANVKSQRIVSLDYGLASTLLSLGVVPVGISELADWDKWVVQPPMPKNVADIGSSFEINFELLTELKPDIILTTPYLDDSLSRLQSIAKTIRLEIFAPGVGPILPAAIAATRKLATELGLENEAEQFLLRSDGFFEACRTRLKGKAVPSIALVNFMDARHARIYSSPGLFHNVLERIGVRNAWARESNYWGFETIAVEQLSAIRDPDARLIAFDPLPPDALAKLEQSPLWQQLPFSQPGHLSILPPALMFGMVNEAVRFAGLLTDLLERDA